MNTNDLPPAARLAALIETGRAANPDLGHGRGRLLLEGRACAVGFACLAAGWTREKLSTSNNLHCAYDFIADATGVPYFNGIRDVWMANDDGASLDEIILSLREGELAKLPA